VLTRGGETLAQDARGLLGEQEPRFSQTLSSWAAENGYTPFSASVRLATDAESYDGGYDVQFLDGGSVVYVFSASGMRLESGQEMNLVCTLSPYKTQDGAFVDLVDFENREETTLGFTIGEIPVLPSVTHNQPIAFATAGIVVDYVKLSSSPLATYCEVEFTVVDAEKFASFNDGLFLRVLNADGEQYLSGLSSGGSFGPIPNEEGRYSYHGNIEAMETLPPSIQLQLFDLGNGKQVVDTQTVTLS
jgi:hypothetical protein